MAGDDLVLDLVVDALGKNATRDELIFGGVGAAVDDALGVGITDAGEGLELIRGAVLMSRGAVVAAAVAAAGLGVWATLKMGVIAKRSAAANSLRRRLDIGGSPRGVDALLRKSTRESEARQ